MRAPCSRYRGFTLVEVLVALALLAIALAAAGRAVALSTDSTAEHKKRVLAGWSGVHVEHVEATGAEDHPAQGAPLEVRAFVALGDLAPEDVSVEVVHGRVAGDDHLLDQSAEPLTLVESYEGGRNRYEATLVLARTGPFGFTVRVLPRHELLAGPAELGVVALA